MSSRKRARETNTESSSSSKKYRPAETKTPQEAKQDERLDENPFIPRERRDQIVQNYNDAGHILTCAGFHRENNYLCAIFGSLHGNTPTTVQTVCRAKANEFHGEQLPNNFWDLFPARRFDTWLPIWYAKQLIHPNPESLLNRPYCWFAPSNEVLFYTLPVAERRKAIFSVLEQVSSSFGFANAGKIIWDYAGATIIYFIIELSTREESINGKYIEYVAYAEDLIQCNHCKALLKRSKKPQTNEESLKCVSCCVGYEDLF